MKTHARLLPWLFLPALLLPLCMSCRRPSCNTALYKYLPRADSVLAQQDYYRILMDNRIRNLRQEADMARTEEARYLANRLLAECYRSYISDSAVAVLNRNLRLARQLDNLTYQIEALMGLTYVLSAAGDFDAAGSALGQLQSLRLTPWEQAQYYVLSIYYYNHLQDFFRRPYRFQIEQCCDSLLQMDPTVEPDARLWARFWKEYPDRLTAELRDDMEARVEELDPSDRHWYANLCWALAVLYKTQDDLDNSSKYLVETLVTDVEHCNNDIPSLYTLCYWCYQAGDYDKAHHYIKYYLERQTIYPLRTQGYSIAGTMENLYELSTATAVKRSKWKQLIIFLSLSTVVILLLVLFYLIYGRKRHLRRAQEIARKNAELDQSLHELHATQDQLREANRQLHDRNAHIRNILAQLAHANQAKEEHIAALFTQCSGYITKMDEQRKTVLRQLKVKKYEDLNRFMSSSDVIVAQEVQELYKNFDALFLAIYPDFIRDFNTLLRPEEQVAQRSPDSLNNDLRIYALIRLGISSSAKIAEALHLSPQTVYNARTRMRSRAICPPEEFPQRVRRLGNFQQDAIATDSATNQTAGPAADSVAGSTAVDPAAAKAPGTTPTRL